MSGNTHKIIMHSRTGRRLPASFGAVLLCLCLSALVAPIQAQSAAQPQMVSLTAQPLSSALRGLGRQFSVQIVYLKKLVKKCLKINLMMRMIINGNLCEFLFRS